MFKSFLKASFAAGHLPQRSRRHFVVSSLAVKVLLRPQQRTQFLMIDALK